MKNTFISKTVNCALCFFVVISFLACSKDKKNHILILDTSMSMIGYGGKNILNSVKTGIENYIDKVDDGDTITFMTFASQVKMYPTVTVNNKNDRDILKKYITRVEADGKWTYTLLMMNKAFEAAEQLERNNGRQTVLAIMTDGLDDPPPGNVKYNFKKLVSKYQGRNWWIYVISFSDYRKTSDFAQSKLQGLNKIAKTTVISGGANPKDAIDQKLTKDIKDYEQKNKSNALFYILIMLLVGAIAAGVVIWLKRFKAGKVEGYLQYWNNELLDPSVDVFHMTQRMSHEIIVGNTLGSHLNLRDLEINAPFKILARREGGLEIKAGGADYQIEFANKEQSVELVDGDIFKVNNYTFKYSLNPESVE